MTIVFSIDAIGGDTSRDAGLVATTAQVGDRDNATGDADGDGICANLDCDDGDPANVCLVFSDGFDLGDTTAWSSSVP